MVRKANELAEDERLVPHAAVRERSERRLPFAHHGARDRQRLRRASGSTTGSPASAPAERSRELAACCDKERPETKIVVCEPADAPMLTQRHAAGAQAGRLARVPASVVEAAPDSGMEPGLHSEARRRRGGRRATSTRCSPIAAPDAMKLEPPARAEGRDLRRHVGGRDVRRRAGGRGRRAEGIRDPLHAPGHRRAVSQHAAVRRHPRGDDGGGGEDRRMNSSRLSALGARRWALGPRLWALGPRLSALGILLMLPAVGRTQERTQGRTEPPEWTRGAVCYEIFVRSFQDSDGDGIGDLNGLIATLDYINDGNPRDAAPTSAPAASG